MGTKPVIKALKSTYPKPSKILVATLKHSFINQLQKLTHEEGKEFHFFKKIKTTKLTFTFPIA